MVKVCLGPTTHFGWTDNSRMEHRFSKQHSSGFEFRVFLLLYWLLYQGYRAHYTLLFTYSKGWKGWIYTFPKGKKLHKKCKYEHAGSEVKYGIRTIGFMHLLQYVEANYGIGRIGFMPLLQDVEAKYGVERIGFMPLLQGGEANHVMIFKRFFLVWLDKIRA